MAQRRASGARHVTLGGMLDHLKVFVAVNVSEIIELGESNALAA